MTFIKSLLYFYYMRINERDRRLTIVYTDLFNNQSPTIHNSMKPITVINV